MYRLFSPFILFFSIFLFKRKRIFDSFGFFFVWHSNVVSSRGFSSLSFVYSHVCIFGLRFYVFRRNLAHILISTSFTIRTALGFSSLHSKLVNHFVRWENVQIDSAMPVWLLLLLPFDWGYFLIAVNAGVVCSRGYIVNDTLQPLLLSSCWFRNRYSLETILFPISI